MLYLGIDPGVSGGFAVLDHEGNTVRVSKMLATERDIWEWMYDVTDLDDIRAYIERLGGMPRRESWSTCKRCGAKQKGSAPMQSPTTMLTMGISYGGLRMAMIAAGIVFDEVLPRTWQTEFGLIFKGGKLSPTEKKNRHKAKAQQLWPDQSITHATADALLIAEYCRRKYHLLETKPF